GSGASHPRRGSGESGRLDTSFDTSARRRLPEPPSSGRAYPSDVECVVGAHPLRARTDATPSGREPTWGTSCESMPWEARRGGARTDRSGVAVVCRNRNRGAHRVGDEAVLVRQLVELREILRGRLRTAEADPRPQHDSRHGELAVLVLLHEADCGIVVR